MFVHQIRILRPMRVTDRYGNSTNSWTWPDEVDTAGWLTQTGQSELLEQREGQVTDWLLYLPAGTDIVAGDRVVWVDDDGDEESFEVDGRPARRWRPASGEHHLEVNLRAVEG